MEAFTGRFVNFFSRAGDSGAVIIEVSTPLEMTGYFIPADRLFLQISSTYITKASDVEVL